MTLPRVLCRGWRSSMGSIYPCASPVIQAGEPGGRLVHDAICPACLAQQHKADATRYAREYAAAQRRKSQGKCKTVTEPFDGMTEPRADKARG